jgi:hypothetical protein
MAKLLYWPLIAVCFYTGFRAYSAWAILPLGAAATIAFSIVKPDALKTGVREPGAPYYLLAIFAGNSVITGILFGIGWLAARVIHEISN